MTRRQSVLPATCVVLVVLLTTPACRRPAPGTADTSRAGAAPTGAAHQAEEGHAAGILRLDSAVLRDLRVTTTTVEPRAARQVVSLLGELGPNEDAYALVSSPVEARVVRVTAGVGDRVRRGARLAELESADIGEARAALDVAAARRQLAARTAARRRELLAQRIAPRREVEEVEAALAEADAVLGSARARLATLGMSDADAASGDGPRFGLHASVAGTVIDRAIVTGQRVGPDTVLFRVGDLSSLWLTVHAFERDAVRLQSGSAAQVTLAALPGETFAARVALVGRQVDAASRTLPVRMVVENRTGRLRPGMSGSATVAVGEASARVLAVPSAAVQRFEGTWVVFLPKGAGAFEIREVGRGLELQGEVEVVSGLAPGETVVVDGAFLLKAEAEKRQGGGEGRPHGGGA